MNHASRDAIIVLFLEMDKSPKQNTVPLRLSLDI